MEDSLYRPNKNIAVLRNYQNNVCTQDKNIWISSGGLAPPSFIETQEEDYYDDYEEDQEIIATNGETFPWDDLRLPKFINPVRYDIELTPNLTSLWVKGR